MKFWTEMYRKVKISHAIIRWAGEEKGELQGLNLPFTGQLPTLPAPPISSIPPLITLIELSHFPFHALTQWLVP